MISKELLSEVLDCNIDYFYIEENILKYDNSYENFEINIYELAFRARDYFKTKNNHLSLNQSIKDIFNEANSIYESLSSK